MSYTSKVVSLRAELKEDLRDKVLMTSDQLEARYDDEELEDAFYHLPQTLYTDKNGFAYSVYIFALEGSIFKCIDNETSDIVTIEMDWVTLDALAEFLDLEPIS